MFQPPVKSNKPVPAPRRSLSTGGTIERVKRLDADESTVSVQLTRGPQGYGFSLRGGQDLGMPLFILRMADGGTAHRDGRLKVRKYLNICLGLKRPDGLPER